MSVSGIAYEDATSLVETIVSLKKKKYQFPGVDAEDMAQDIRVICWEALSRFDQAKLGKSVFHYVARCVDNRLYNNFRGVFLDNNPPCLRCPEYIKATKECRIDEVGCDRIVQYRERMSRRRAIAAPTSYSILDDSEDSSEPDALTVGSTTGVSDLSDTLRAALTEDLKSYYDLIVAGHSDKVPPSAVKAIQQIVRATLAKGEDL
jgi:hypothetical protein